MNFAGIHRLPAVYILENNQFAYSTPNELEFAIDPVERAAGYGLEGASVDGNDVEAVFEAAREAVDRARGGGGPSLIECHTMRMHGHGAHDDMRYVPEEMFAEWEKKDPIDRYERRLAEEHGFSGEELSSIRASVEREVAEGAEKALASPMPDPELGLEGVFADSWEPLGDGRAPWSHWASEPAAAGESGGDGRPARGNGRFGPAGEERQAEPTAARPGEGSRGRAA
jgi:TPP-dependent pyruvate/acetoin dehydrogenase alpha subunit